MQNPTPCMHLPSTQTHRASEHVPYHDKKQDDRAQQQQGKQLRHCWAPSISRPPAARAS